MNTLVVYYSRSGKVKEEAISQAKEINADTAEIVCRTCYKGVFGFVKAGYHSVRKHCPVIEPIDIKSYEKIIICGPVWAGTVASPIRSFLTNFKGFFPSLEYIIMHEGPDKYENVTAEMDSICGKKNTPTKSLMTKKNK